MAVLQPLIKTVRRDTTRIIGKKSIIAALESRPIKSTEIFPTLGFSRIIFFLFFFFNCCYYYFVLYFCGTEHLQIMEHCQREVEMDRQRRLKTAAGEWSTKRGHENAQKTHVKIATVWMAPPQSLSLYRLLFIHQWQETMAVINCVNINVAYASIILTLTTMSCCR